MFVVSAVNFEHISHFIVLLTLQNSRKEMLVGLEKLQFQTINLFYSNCEKYIVLWVGKTCWAICFHIYSPNIRLQNEKFSGQCFKKISQALGCQCYNNWQWLFHGSEVCQCSGSELVSCMIMSTICTINMDAYSLWATKNLIMFVFSNFANFLDKHEIKIAKAGSSIVRHVRQSRKNYFRAC